MLDGIFIRYPIKHTTNTKSLSKIHSVLGSIISRFI